MGGDWREREPNSSDSVVVVLLGEYGTVIVGGSRTGTGGTGVVQRSIGGGSFTTRVAPELKAAAQRENSSCIEGIQRKLGTARSSALTFALRNSKIIDSFAPGTARSSALLRLGTARSSGSKRVSLFVG